MNQAHPNPVLTYALLQKGGLGENLIASWLRRTFSKVWLKPPEDLNSRLNSAAGVVVQIILHSACDNIGKPTLAAQFDEIPKGFHIIATFGLCLVMGLNFLLSKEGHTLDLRVRGLSMINALLLMRSPQEKYEQYQLGHALLMKGVKAGGNFTKWQNDLNQLLYMYLLESKDDNPQKYDFSSLFGSMLKTLISAVELPE